MITVDAVLKTEQREARMETQSTRKEAISWDDRPKWWVCKRKKVILCMFLKESKKDFLMTWIWSKEEEVVKEQLEGWGDYKKVSVAR